MTDTATLPPRQYEGLTVPAPGTFDLDVAHTSVSFVVRHLMVSKVRGHFSDFSGSITVADDPAESSVEVSIQAASVDTRDDTRDGHLRSPDFFDVENHPTITFASTGLQHGDGDRFTLAGELTVRGVTRPVELDVELTGVARDPWGGERIGFSASTEVDRGDFGLTFNQALEAGGVMVGTKAKIEIDAEAVRAS